MSRAMAAQVMQLADEVGSLIRAQQLQLAHDAAGEARLSHDRQSLELPDLEMRLVAESGAALPKRAHTEGQRRARQLPVHAGESRRPLSRAEIQAESALLRKQVAAERRRLRDTCGRLNALSGDVVPPVRRPPRDPDAAVVDCLRAELRNAAKEAQHLLLVRALLALHIAPAPASSRVALQRGGRGVRGHGVVGSSFATQS